MKRSFLYFSIVCVACLSLHVSCKKNTAPILVFQTAYSTTSDTISVVDDENAMLNVSLDDLGDFSKYTYSFVHKDGNVHINDTLKLSKEFSIDLKKAAIFKKYTNQDVDLNVTLIGDGTSETITHDIDYLFDATSPIPYVVINTTSGKFPEDRTRLDADFEFYDVPMKDGWYSLSGEHQSGAGTIHARGQGSLGFAKKSFALNLGKENPISIMGMPESHKWVMIANWVDTSQLCNKIAYDSYAEMGNYGPQSRHVQVFLNGEYWGLYTFGEKIQRGKNHVDTKKKSKGGFIVKEVDNAPDFVTISGRTFQYEYPDNEEVTEEQKVDIQKKINLYEEKVQTGSDWENYVAEEAEIDYFIMTDVFANPDSYYNGKNVFYFYNRDNKLEPVIWDFIWAFGTPYYTCHGNNPWCYIYSPIGAAYCPTPNCTWGTSYLKPDSELMYGNKNYGYSVGFNRFQLMKQYLKTPQNVNMFKDRYFDWRTGSNGKQAVLSDKNILARTDKLIEILRSGEIYKKDSLRWSVEPDFRNKKRFSPEDVRKKIKERLEFMDTEVKNLKVQ